MQKQNQQTVFLDHEFFVLSLALKSNKIHSQNKATTKSTELQQKLWEKKYYSSDTYTLFSLQQADSID